MSQHPPHVDWELWRVMSLMNRQLATAVEQRLRREADISTAEFEILNALSEAPEGRVRAGQLSELVGWEKSRVSHQVARMERRLLLARTECAADLRGTWVELRPAGRAALTKALPAYRDEVTVRFFGRLPPTHTEALREAASAVVGIPCCELEGFGDDQERPVGSTSRASTSH